VPTVVTVGVGPERPSLMRYQQTHYERIADVWPYAIFRRIDGAR